MHFKLYKLTMAILYFYFYIFVQLVQNGLIMQDALDMMGWKYVQDKANVVVRNQDFLKSEDNQRQCEYNVKCCTYCLLIQTPSLQKLIDLIHSELVRLKLKLNVSKCYLMIFYT